MDKTPTFSVYDLLPEGYLRDEIRSPLRISLSRNGEHGNDYGRGILSEICDQLEN